MSNLGDFGLKFVPQYYPELIEQELPINCLEIMTENYLGSGGRSRHDLLQLAQRYQLVLHGVSLSLGSVEEPDFDYLLQLARLAKELGVRHVSDHLCFTSSNGINSHDLLPLPYTEAVIEHVSQRILTVQDFLGQQILIENVSSYLTYPQSECSEWEFLTAISEKSDCLLLLDVNNVFVSAHNHKFDPLQYIQALPAARIAEIHVAGHAKNGPYLLDTHATSIIPQVWQLYKAALKHCTHVPLTIIERDANLPTLDELINEVEYARKLANG